MKLTREDRLHLANVAKRALTYSGIVVIILAILMGVYYMGIRFERERIKSLEADSMYMREEVFR